LKDERPRLSVVIGTSEGWPYVRDLIQSLRADAEETGTEIVVADLTTKPPPTTEEVGPNVRWLKFDAPSVFSLYALALPEARGEIVATTEDHAIPRPGWIQAVLRAHAEHPEAAAIGGAIENGSTESLLDWASYFSTQGPHMAPLGDHVVQMTTNEANVSYKRWALEDFDDNDGLGFMAILHNRRLAEEGKILRVDDRMVVDHMETVGFVGQTSIHFHNGKSIAGFRRRNGMTDEDWLRMAVSMALPGWRTLRIVRTGMAKGRLRAKVLASAPWTLWLEISQGLGHLLGYALGPGGSPRHLR
jgi:hypothetical protein